MAKRAGEELFDELHSLLTTELVARIKSGEASTADLRAAIDWLSKNDITGVPISGSPLASLAGLIPELTFDDVQRSF
jgi:hypothetical protein